MKRYLLVPIFIIGVTCMVQAQFNAQAPWMQPLNSSKKSSYKATVKAFNKYWNSKDENQKGSGYKPFKRWECHWKNYILPNGNLPNSKDQWSQWNAFNAQKNSSPLNDVSNWLPIGPFNFTNTGSWSAGQGRVNAILVDPNNPNVYYVGAPAGGLWKSIDAGTTWQALTDFLPQIGISAIAVDTNNSNTIYIATGDDDGAATLSVGVMKSTNGGQTWQTTGLNPNNTPNFMSDIFVHPTNSNTIWVATSSGVFTSYDAGVTWSNTNGTENIAIKDLKIHPTNPAILYAASSSSLYKSTDGGISFNLLSGTDLPTASGRLVLGVTPANPEVLYVFSANLNGYFQGIFKSDNAGTSFTTIATLQTAGNLFDGSRQYWFDMAFAVSDTNENEIYTGVLNIWKGIVSNDTASFTKINYWNRPNEPAYTHADIHYLNFFNTALFVASDGGIYKSTNNGASFTNLTSGLQIGQFYKIAVAKQNSSKLVGGLQDNGGYAYNQSLWQNYYGADGMDTAIDPNNPNLYYGFIQRGFKLCISNAAGASLSHQIISPEIGNWVTPLVINKDSEIFAGFKSVYQLIDGSWHVVSSSFSSEIDLLEIDAINTNIMYVAINKKLYKSMDKGITFSLLQTFSENITALETHNSNSNILYLTTNYNVFTSIDAGTTFTTINGSLPNVSKNCIKHQDLHPDNPLFLGTSLGVYRYDDNSQDWHLFSNNLPHVSVTDLEINTTDNTLTAATFGRGVWQSTIPTQQVEYDIKVVEVLGIESAINCTASLIPEVVIKNNGTNTIHTISLQYVKNEMVNFYNWSGVLLAGEQTTISLPVLNFPLGINHFWVEAFQANDLYTSNNRSLNYTIYNTTASQNYNMNTFENATDELLVINENDHEQYWERGIPTGNYLNNSMLNCAATNNMYATNLNGAYTNNMKSYLLTNCYDLTSYSTPILQFDMAFNLEANKDIFYIEYSTNQGESWHVLGSAEDTNWYNSALTASANNTCNNCMGAQWTGDNLNLTNYHYNLNEFANETNILFRFVFHSNSSIVKEGVVIDNLTIEEQTLQNQTVKQEVFSIAPNPANTILEISFSEAAYYQYSLTDVFGKIMQQQNRYATTTKSQIDISNFASGMYFLTIKHNNKHITKKIIVN